MPWLKRVTGLFGVATTATLLATTSEAIATDSPPTIAGDGGTRQDMLIFSSPRERAMLSQLAAHRSHSSHSSHRSHYSSSSGGTYRAPSTPSEPRYTAPSYAVPQAPAAGSSAAVGGLRMTEDDKSAYVQRVQVFLAMKGFDPGVADGHLGEKTKEALKDYQKSVSIAPSGQLDAVTVRSIGIAP